jgi:hypothetical protein
MDALAKIAADAVDLPLKQHDAETVGQGTMIGRTIGQMGHTPRLMVTYEERFEHNQALSSFPTGGSTLIQQYATADTPQLPCKE